MISQTEEHIGTTWGIKNFQVDYETHKRVIEL